MPFCRWSNLVLFISMVVMPSVVGFLGFVLDGRILGPYFIGLLVTHIIMQIFVWMPLWTHLSLKEKEKFAAGD